jgi:uncharacterized membrane protein
MQKRWLNKYGIWVAVVLFIAAVFLSSQVSYRIDLTAEKRHSVTRATK